MSQHACQHMMSPPRKLPHLVVIHPQIRFGFLKALLDGPTNPRKPGAEVLRPWPASSESNVLLYNNAFGRTKPVIFE